MCIRDRIDRTCCISTKKVVVLMPPPVDPGDAPTNINTIMTSRPALLKPLRSTVEKPAVRAVMLWKNAVIKSRWSVICSSAAPPNSNTAVVVSTTLVLSLIHI